VEASADVKLVIAKLIEVAYSANEGLTAKIVLEKGPFKLTMDEQGNGMLTGKAGVVRFNGSPALEKVGLALKRVSVNFSNGGNDRVKYVASVDFIKAASFSVAGSFSAFELITACSGLLCKAARALKGFDTGVDAQMQQIMGQ